MKQPSTSQHDQSAFSFLPPGNGRPPRWQNHRDNLYLALRPPRDTADQIASDRLRWQDTRGWDHVAPDCFHMSMVSCGRHDGLPDGLVPAINRTMIGFAAPRVEVIFDRLLKFGGNAIMLSRSAENQSVRRLRQALLSWMSVLPVVALANSRNFEPHVTLSYSNDRFDGFELAPVSWWATEIVLIHSRIGTGRQAILGRWPLTGANFPPLVTAPPAQPDLFQ